MPQSSKQITVPLPIELVSFVERAAQKEDRTVAAQVRHYIAQAARQAGGTTQEAAR